MKIAKASFSFFGLITLMLMVPIGAAVAIVLFCFMLLAENSTLGLGFLILSPFAYIILFCLLERELLFYWLRKDELRLIREW